MRKFHHLVKHVVTWNTLHISIPFFLGQCFEFPPVEQYEVEMNQFVIFVHPRALCNGEIMGWRFTAVRPGSFWIATFRWDFENPGTYNLRNRRKIVVTEEVRVDAVHSKNYICVVYDFMSVVVIWYSSVKLYPHRSGPRGCFTTHEFLWGYKFVDVVFVVVAL